MLVLVLFLFGLNGTMLTILEDTDEELENIDGDLFYDYILVVFGSIIILMFVTVILEFLLV